MPITATEIIKTILEGLNTSVKRIKTTRAESSNPEAKC